MMWQKEFGYDYHKNKDFLLVSMLILSIFALIVNRPLLFLIVGLFGAYIVLNYIYDKYIGKHLMIVNDRQVIRLFPEDEVNITIKWQNNSLIPYMNGRFKFQIDKNVTSNQFVSHVDEQVQTFTIPLSLISRSQTTLNVPIIAKKRGVTRLRQIQYDIPHLFNFDELRLNYDNFFSLEIVVFPKLLPVKQTEQLFEFQPGEEIVHFSPFEDILSPLGTRSYTYSDPFQRINWKATAKTGQLQTNIYEKTIEQSYFFIINLTSDHEVGKSIVSSDIEDLLSYTAYLTGEATKKKIAYEVAINARRFGDRRYIHLAKGQGRSHYMKTLDILARVHPLSVSMSFIDMLYRLRQHVLTASTMVFIGDVPEEAKELLEEWQRQHKRLYHVKLLKDEAILQQWAKEVV